MLGSLNPRKRNAGAAPGLPPGVDSLDALTASPPWREALQLFARQRRWIDETHLALCRIPAPTFQEQARAEWVIERLAALGLEGRQDRAGNVCAVAGQGARQGPLVAVTAHLDTVLAPRDATEIRVDEAGRFLGPGVSDNGCGLAALLALARMLTEYPEAAGPGAGVLLVFNVGEEGDGNLSGMRFLCKNSPFAPRIRSFLVLDGPSLEQITAEALACRRFEIGITGPGGHSWSDHGTANPVHALARCIAWFSDARAAESPQARRSWNFGVIDGGTTVNAIPASVKAKVDLRSASPEVLEALAAELSSVLERAVQAENDLARAGRVTARLRETGSRPGGRLPEGSPLLAYLRAVDAYLGVRSVVECASTDANVPLSLGLPAVSIGAGGTGGGAHTPREWYQPEGRELGLRRAALFLRLLLAEAAAAQ
jgi:tripeptide aminopeptidase